MSGGKRFKNRNKGHWMLAAVVAASLACASASLRADGADQNTAAARLSNVDGQLRIAQGGQVIADPAPANAPLFDGAQLITAEDGKAEVQFENGGVARISPNSSLTIVALNGPYGTEVVLDGGLGYFELPDGANGQMRIHFGSSIVTVSSAAVLRIRLDALPGELAVFSGNARLERDGMQPLDLQDGQSVALDANNPARYELSQIVADSWDSWNSDRDAALNAEATNRTEATSSFAGQDNTGAAWNDLDANGNWYEVPGQGYIWSPFSASNAGWDPYGCGRWMWTPSRGYVWVSCESWGFMPYMCGSWSYFDGFGWGWAPGAGFGCGGGWSLGHFGGTHIRRAPVGYLPIARPHPGSGRQIAGPPAPVVVVRREPRGGSERLPVRARDTPISIGGQTIRPMPPAVSSPGYRHPDQNSAGRTGAKPGVHVSAPISGRSIQSKPANSVTGMPVQRPGYSNSPSGSQPGQSYAHPSQPIQGSSPATQPLRNPTAPGNTQQPGTKPTQDNQPRPHSIFSGWKSVGGSPDARPTPSSGRSGNNNRPSYTAPSGSSSPRPTGGGGHPAPSGGGGSHPAPSGGGSHSSPSPSSNNGGHR